MRRRIITIYLLIFFLFTLLLVYYFIYNVYGSEIRKTPEYLFSDQESEMIIEVVPINALGSKAVFRTSSAKFEIIEGNDLIEVIMENTKKGVLKIRSKGKPGKVGINIKSEHSLLTEYIEIEILPRIV
jgi:hypothetical protein